MIVMDLLGGSEEVIELVASGPTVRSVARGRAVLPASLTETIFSYLARRGAARGADTSVSPAPGRVGMP
jgi:hypothetical protein